MSEETVNQEPTIVFIFDLKNWFENISVLSKLDIIDMVPVMNCQFYYNETIKSYVLILVKSVWDLLDDKVKYKFSILSRRIKEEMEGPMSNIIKEKYENTDLFELLMNVAIEEKKVVQENVEITES